jgi:hypothetical protein
MADVLVAGEPGGVEELGKADATETAPVRDACDESMSELL